MSENKLNLSRRSFLKSAAIVAAGGSMIAGGLAGCAPKTPAAAPKSEGASSSDPMQIRKASTMLNPQSTDIVGTTSDFATLLSEFKLGSLTLPHRIVKSAAGSDTQSNPEEIAAYYTNFAKGGVGMVWMEDCADKFEHFPNARAASMDSIPFKDIADGIHAAGGYVGYQLSCMGIAFSGTKQDGAGKFASAVAGDMTLEEIKTIQQDTINAAKKLQDLGLDAVEINAAGNNIGQSFFSRMRNKRTDEYGPQSFENRARFVCETIQGIKEACGKDFVVQALINGIEENDEKLGDSTLMTTIEENLEIAKLLEAAGADSLHVRLGPLGMHVCQFASDLYFAGYGVDGTTAYGTQFDFTRHWQGKLITDYSGCGMMLDVAKEFKSAVSIPVGTVTYMDPAHAPEFFESALKEGKVDFLLMNRPLTVDTEYVNKLKAGKLDEIAPCTRCLHCHFDYDADGKIYEHCRVNACTQRAYRKEMPEGFDPTPASSAKQVLVVGGGPAGMEAARIAASRGHKVTLYEQKDALGGLLDFAHAVKGPHENLDALKSYLVHQVDLAGVEVKTGTTVDVNTIKEAHPDVLIVACGGKRPESDISSSSSVSVVSIADFLTSEIGDRVVVLGSNAQAVDASMYLLAQGKAVTMVTADDATQVDKGQSNWVKTFVLPAMYAKGMRVWPHAEVKEVGDGEVIISGETGADMHIPCDTVVDARDMLENKDLGSGFDGEVYYVGDCNKPWNIAEAIAAGNLTARAI